MINYIRQATLQLFVLSFYFTGLSFSAFADSLVPQTGQTNCYDTFGVEITCADTGQDGDLRKGVEWPIPRFTDNGDGTVSDHFTGLTWVQWILCFSGDWAASLAHVNELADGLCGLSDGSAPGEWRMPNIKELMSTIDYGEHSPALPAGAPFTPAIVGPRIWSSTSDMANRERVYAVSLADGSNNFADKVWDFPYAWAVRDTPVAPTQCSDGVDNDGDGRIDLDDKQCRSADQDSEKHPNR